MGTRTKDAACYKIMVKATQKHSLAKQVNTACHKQKHLAGKIRNKTTLTHTKDKKNVYTAEDYRDKHLQTCACEHC